MNQQPPLQLPPQLNHPFSLYAGNLHPDVNEYHLINLFTTISPSHTVYICRDRFSRKSLGYGYVNFSSANDAANALSRLNHIELLGKYVRLMWSKRDGFLRKTGVGNIFVKNIDFSVTDARLEEIFWEFGNILSCKVARNESGVSMSYGYVHFSSEESASNAIKALNGTELNGKILSVSKFVPRGERKEVDFTKIYVQNLDERLSESSMKRIFSEYGKVNGVNIVYDAQGKSKGYGFVDFELSENAQRAIEGLNGFENGSTKWYVGKAFPKSSYQRKPPEISKVSVKNLAPTVTDEILYQSFAKFGDIQVLKVFCSRNGKGMGHVTFSKPEDAIRAVENLNGFYLHGLPMSLILSKRNEEYARYLEAIGVTFPVPQNYSEILSNLRKMEENFERDNRKGKAEVEDTDQNSLPPKTNRNKDDEYYYVRLFGQLRFKDTDGPDSLEGVTRKLFSVRNKDIVSFLGNEDEKLKIIHRDSGATVGISSDPVSRIHRHSYLELLGTVDQVKIAEILITDAIKEMYEKPFVPTALMPTIFFQDEMIVPLLKVSHLLGLYGNNLVKMEVKTGAWIELDTNEPSSDGKSWVTRVRIYGSHQQISNAMDMITQVVYEEPVIPEDRMSTPKFAGSRSTEESEKQEFANLDGENEQHAFVGETTYNDSVKEPAASIEENGSDQLGNGKEHVEEKEAPSPNSNSDSI